MYSRGGNRQARYHSALGSALALFLYPHSVTGILAASSGHAIRRNAALLPGYSFMLGLLALIGFFAIAAGVATLPEFAAGFKQFGSNFAVPALLLHTFPSWFVGVAFAAVGIGALLLVLRATGAPKEHILLYAWHPLPVWEIAGSGHVEAAVVAFVALALVAAVTGRRAWSGAGSSGAGAPSPLPSASAAAYTGGKRVVSYHGYQVTVPASAAISPVLGPTRRASAIFCRSSFRTPIASGMVFSALSRTGFCSAT